MKKILLLTALYAGGIIALMTSQTEAPPYVSNINNTTSKREKVDGPAEFAKFHRAIRTADGETKPGYAPGYKFRELNRAKSKATRARTQNTNGVLEWKERGPSNVPGRTRGLIVDPDDLSRNTWYAGSVGGGVWKTTNGGGAWTLITPDLPNLATTVIGMANSNRNIMYVGTGEGFFNLDAINGGGIFKSTDRGLTWNILPTTIGFGDINRMAISPTDANLVVVVTTLGIYRTSDGGTNWTQVLEETNVQDLKVHPTNFNIQYAAQNSEGIWKSTDAGQTWTFFNNGMGAIGRIELAVSPVNTNRIFASAEESFGEGAKLLISEDAGLTWNAVNVQLNNAEIDFLGGQGWYDNTIACDPFDQDIVYVGGVSLFRVEVTSGSSTVSYYDVDAGTTNDFLSLVNFGANFNNGTLDVSNAANASVEIRFGPGKTQKAHRFMVPEGSTSGVADLNYAYQDYVNVPFEVWDVTTNRQLMISFRDQGRDGAFNLIAQNTEQTTPANQQSREYIFVSNVTYNATTPNPSMSVAGGHTFGEMYNIWPILSAGATWNPANLPASTFRINFESRPLLNASTITVADAYSQFGGKNNFEVFGIDVHPDHHNLIIIPTSASSYRILNANDGGVFISNSSNTPGINEGDWTMVGKTFNTSQFYGADKRTGFNEYFGGMQDNGTWKSPSGTNASAATQYVFNIGGDGFEVIWNNRDDNLMIGGSQGNGLRRSIDGGTTWTNATNGLSGTAPFITKLANSRSLPDRIFALSSAGVFVSNNFGQSWSLTPISQKWGSGSFMDVEVSRANANIVWAGLGMNANLNLHVSTDGGKTFKITNNYTTVTMGGITKLASHPKEANTAYALFSLAGKPKILKTTNLGESWTDLSGFGTNNTSSSGFPDVAVYCLYVRPDNTNIIWAGTEIGIVESLDGGASWNIVNDFPNASVWDMKGVDDQVVIATHGRGIWTATINAPQSELPKLPQFVSMGTNPSGNLSIKVSSTTPIDSIQVYSGTTYAGSLKNVIAGETVFEIKNTAVGPKSINGIAYIGSSPFTTNTINGQHLRLKANASAHVNYFSSLDDFSLNGFSLRNFAGQGDKGRKSLHSQHPYASLSNSTALLLQPVTVKNSDALVKYRDVVITEPNNDNVNIEATVNGIDWIPLVTPYSSSFNASWTATFNANAEGRYDQMVAHEIDLLDFFTPGTNVLLRFRLTSNVSIQGWGWAIDYVAIQDEPTAAEIPTFSNATNLYPNPAKLQANVQYTLDQNAEVSIGLVDMLGNPIKKIVKGQQQPGTYTEVIETDYLATGSYIVVLKKGKFTETLRLVVQ